MNFLRETKDAIKGSGHSVADLVFIGSRGDEDNPSYSCSWEEFKQLADFDYDPGYGAAYIASDLILVFSDGAIISRREYDGSEWWEYNEPFVHPESSQKIVSLGGGMWSTVAEQQQRIEEARGRR